MEFPFGKAPLVILLLALGSGVGLLLANWSEHSAGRPDLVFAVFSKEHADSYRDSIAEFEKAHNVTVQLQVVDPLALRGRLQAAMEIGADVPDMVEILNGTLGVFTAGPLEDVQFVDLTNRVHQTGLYDKLVSRRFGKWSSRGHIFALPHDVHPVMLAYRRDLVAQLGIDVNKLTTWDAFCKVGRDVVARSRNKDGVVDHYMIDLPTDGGDILHMLMTQHGAQLFDESGNVVFDSDKTVDVVCWYVHQMQGKDCISFPAGWGQTLARAITDGVVLFITAPDWRTKQLENDVPGVAGKMDLIQLPAWEPGGLRTSTWGGTGLAFPRAGKHFDLAWQLAMTLYYDPQKLAARFDGSHVLPPLKAAWSLPEYSTPSPYWGEIALGRTYADLAPLVPKENESSFSDLAESMLSEAFTNTLIYQQTHGDDGLREYAQSELKRCAARVRLIMDRNVFQKDQRSTHGEGSLQ
jgi:arabinosaccharide transport system substrate-binding protein